MRGLGRCVGYFINDISKGNPKQIASCNRGTAALPPYNEKWWFAPTHIIKLHIMYTYVYIIALFFFLCYVISLLLSLDSLEF